MDDASAQLLHGVKIQTRDGKIWDCRPFTIRDVMRFEEWTQQHAAAVAKDEAGKMKNPNEAARLILEMAKAFPAAVGQPDLIDHLNPSDIPGLLVPFYFSPSGAQVPSNGRPSVGTTSSPSSSPSPDSPPAST